MDLSAGGLAPTPRDGASSSQAVVDPLDAFLSPLGSPGLPTDAAAQAALRALRGEESESESSRRPSDSVGGRLEPSRAHASYNEDLKIKGSAGSAGKTKQESSSASKSRSVANTYGRKSYSSRYFDAPERSASQDEPAANDFEAEHALTGFEDDAVSAEPKSATKTSKDGNDSPATQNGAPDSVVPSKSQQGASSGPSQVGGADGDNLSVASGGGGRRYTLTAFRHLARLDKFASEEGRHSPAPEQSTVDEERMDLESEFSVGTGGRARSGYDPTDDGMSVRSGYKRAASEMDRGEYEEEDEFGRYRRSDTPFNESEYPGDDAASSVRSIGPSRTYGRSHRSRSVAFSQRSLYSERSQEEDGDEDSIAPSGDMQDSGFYAAGEGESEKPIVTEPEDENGGVDSEGLLYEGDDDDDAGVASHHAAENDNNEPQYFDFDPLMPMGSIYVGTKHPHLAYAAALAQAAKDADTGAEGGQGPQVEQQVDQENVAPSESEARAQGQKQKTTTTERKETSESVLEKWNAARAGTVERFGGLMSRVDQLLEGKIRRHEKLDSTLTAHQSTLNERYQQLRQTKAGLRHWGNQLFTSLKTAEQESDAAAVATAAAAAAAAKEGEIAMPTEQAEVAGGQHGGKATATDLTSNGEAEATPAEAPVTSVDES